MVKCLVVFPYRLTLPSIYSIACRLPPTFWLSARHLSSVLFLSPPPKKQQNVYPHWCFTNTFFHSTTLSLNPISHFTTPTTPPATQPVLCSLHPTPRQHPLSPPDMSHLKPFPPLTPIITPTLHLHDHPRTNLVSWKIAINRAARGVFAEWDAYGFLFGVCDDAVWAVLYTPPGQQLRGGTPRFPDPG
jgi:hypothetical protein